MTSPQSDQELGKIFRSKAASLGYSSDALLQLAEASANFQRWTIMPNFLPWPSIELEETLGTEHLAAWPAWTAKLISPGCRIESMTWPDGTTTTRLLSSRGLVLAASIEHPSSSK